ncbi:MAG: DUF58 domain-containing protein, partial [Myxococcota bacterium]|nr:DUF58 domain-containing protein [Myxococcota bacterium]
ASVVVLFVGGGLDIPLLFLWGTVLSGMVLTAWPLTYSVSAEVRRGGIMVRVGTLQAPSGMITKGARVHASLNIRNRTARRWAYTRLRLFKSSSLTCEQPEQCVDLPNNQEISHTFVLSAARVGPAAIYGVEAVISGPMSLFQIHLYIPSQASVAVLPAPYARDRYGSHKRSLMATHRPSSTGTSKRTGSGYDLRELREYQSGDAVNHIAWKASARRGKLVSRVFEAETTASTYILIDSSPTMRAGAVGKAPLDDAVNLAAYLAQRCLIVKGKVGLCSFDHAVLGFTRATQGSLARLHIRAHLFELNAVVHEGFTNTSKGKLYDVVGSYLLSQEGLDYRLPAQFRPEVAQDPWDETAIQQHIRPRVLSQHHKLRTATRVFGAPDNDPSLAALRSFCRLQNISVPYRVAIAASSGLQGLNDAIKRCSRDRTTRHTFILISDLASVRDADEFSPCLRLITQHRHRLVTLPVTGGFVAESMRRSSLEQRLAVLFERERSQRQQALLRSLRGRGVQTDLASALAPY